MSSIYVKGTCLSCGRIVDFHEETEPALKDLNFMLRGAAKKLLDHLTKKDTHASVTCGKCGSRFMLNLSSHP